MNDKRQSLMRNTDAQVFRFTTQSYSEVIGKNGPTPDSELKGKLRRIRNNNNRLDIWFRSENDGITWPRRLVTPESIGPRMRAAGFELLLDSDIQNGDVTNQDVIREGTKYNADYMVPADITAADCGDAEDPALEAQVQSTQQSKAFRDLWRSWGRPGKIIYPLQPPHDEHFLKYEDFYRDKSFLGLGGLRGKSTDEQVEAVRRLRAVVGDDVWLHGFGFGCSPAHLDELWSERAYLDSVDVSTFEKLPANNVILDADMTQFQLTGSTRDLDDEAQYYSTPTGHLVSGINAAQAERFLHMYAYECTDLSNRAPRGEETPDAPIEQDEHVKDTNDNMKQLEMEEWI